MTPRTSQSLRPGQAERAALRKSVRFNPAKADALLRYQSVSIAERFRETALRLSVDLQDLGKEIRVGSIVLEMLFTHAIEAPPDEQERIRVMNWCYANRADEYR